MKGFEERTDAELAAAAQSGDVLAEGALVKRYASLAEGRGEMSGFCVKR